MLISFFLDSFRIIIKSQLLIAKGFLRIHLQVVECVKGSYQVKLSVVIVVLVSFSFLFAFNYIFVNDICSNRTVLICFYYCLHTGFKNIF